MDGLVLDLVVSKLHRPPVRPGTVRRSLLVDRLSRPGLGPIVSVVAPAGYGKTTLLSQWAERSGQNFAWVSLDEADNDPKVMLTYIAEALDEIEPIDGRVFDALVSPGSSVPGSAVPRLGAAFSSMSERVVLVLDDVHVLHNRECRTALSMLADHVPEGSRLALAGRAEPPLRTARLRAEGRILEIGPGELALSRQEASSLLRGADLTLGTDEMTALYQQTEGWATGLYLGALCLKDGGSLGLAAASFGGDDRFINDYLESELLSHISPWQRAFLTRTAALDRMSGPLCDAALKNGGASAAALAELAKSNLLLVPLDRQGEWYRYHHLFRDMLLAELRRHEPELIPVLHRRAAEWYQRAGEPAEALEYSMKAGDVDTAARLAGTLAFPAYQQGRGSTVERWFRWLEAHDAMDRNPVLPVLAAILAAVTGKPTDAERWAGAAGHGGTTASLPDGSPTIEPWLAVMRGLLCRDGVDRLRADAELATRTVAAGSFWRTAPRLLLGMAHLMAGDRDRADLLFEDTVTDAESSGVTIGACIALAERSLLAITEGAWDLAGQYLSQARLVARKAHLEDYPLITVLYAAAARMAIHEGDRPRARAELTQAQRTRPSLTYALPHLAAQARIELARCHLALLDVAAARTLVREAEQILVRRPDLGVFAQQVRELRAELSRTRGSSPPGASSLTAAEMRLLPMLSTHLSFAEIAEELFLSPHTVKSQAMSLYRKLSASSRSEAVTRSRELGLVEG